MIYFTQTYLKFIAPYQVSCNSAHVAVAAFYHIGCSPEIIEYDCQSMNIDEWDMNIAHCEHCSCHSTSKRNMRPLINLAISRFFVRLSRHHIHECENEWATQRRDSSNSMERHIQAWRDSSPKH